MRKNAIKLNAIICSIMLFVASFPASSFAKTIEEEPSTIQAAENLADSVANASGDVDIVDEYDDVKDAYLVGDETISYELPKDGDEVIRTTIDGDVVISMSLPKELSLDEATITGDGSVIYNNSEDASICTQIIEQDVQGEKVYFNRTSAIIEDANASHKYTFEFTLPEGYSICTAKEYNERQAEYYREHKNDLFEVGLSEEEYDYLLSQLAESDEELYIVDSEDNVVEVIEEAWAKDANGNDVATRYELEGNCVTQVVEFNENSVFPIVADPSVGATKSFSVKVSNSTMGLPSLAGTPLTAAAKKVLKEKTKQKIVAVVGSKFVPGLNIATWVVAAFAYINEKTGKSGVEIYGTMIYRKHESQKEGTITYGWDVKSIKARRY